MNGTYVNGHRIAAPTALKSGDEITAGGSRVVFEWADDAAERAPSGPRVVVIREGEVDLPEIARRSQRIATAINIGRSRDCDIYLDDDKVSHHHASIELRPDGIFLVDVGSTNGTFLAGHKLHHHVATPLHEGDEITLGRSKLRLDVR